MIFWPLLLAATTCVVPGDAPRWRAVACPGPKACPAAAGKDPCENLKSLKRVWCEQYIQGGGKTTLEECVDDRALLPAGIEDPVTERDVKLDGRPCKQLLAHHPDGKRRESRILCDGKREGVYEAWSEAGETRVKGGYAADQAAGVWSVFAADGRLAYKLIYRDGHATERSPPLTPGAAAYEVFLSTVGTNGKSALRVEADGKVTRAGGAHGEAYLGDAAYDELQSLLAKAWPVAAEPKGCGAKGGVADAELTVALRFKGEIRRAQCRTSLTAELEAVRSFVADRIASPDTDAGRLLALSAATSDESPGALDFPGRGPKK